MYCICIHYIKPYTNKTTISRCNNMKLKNQIGLYRKLDKICIMRHLKPFMTKSMNKRISLCIYCIWNGCTMYIISVYQIS